MTDHAPLALDAEPKSRPVRPEIDLQRFFDNTLDLFCIGDVEGNFHFVSPSFERTLGYAQDDLIGQSFRGFIHPDDLALADGEMVKLRSGEDSVRSITRFRHKDGRWLWLSWMCPASLDENGMFYAIAHDVTDLIEYEQDLQRQREESDRKLAQREAELNEAEANLRRETAQRRNAEDELRDLRPALAHGNRLAIMGATTAGLAHEINQPLTVIRNHGYVAEMLLAERISAEDRQAKDPKLAEEDTELLENIQKIVAAAERTGMIVRRMRDFVASQPSPRKPVDINHLVRDVVQLFEHEQDTSNRKITLMFEEPELIVHADGVQIHQVIMNLVRNAMDALAEQERTKPTGEGSMSQDRVPNRVFIATARAGDTATISVRDTGPGIPEELHRKIFRHYVTTKPNGMGLGLPISRWFAEAHGGELRIVSSPERGATFRVLLPIAGDVDGAVAAYGLGVVAGILSPAEA